MNQRTKSRQEQSHALNEKRSCLVLERARDLTPYYLQQRMESNVSIPNHILSHRVPDYRQLYPNEKGQDPRVVRAYGCIY